MTLEDSGRELPPPHAISECWSYKTYSPLKRCVGEMTKTQLSMNDKEKSMSVNFRTLIKLSDEGSPSYLR